MNWRACPTACSGRDDLRAYLCALDTEKPVVYCGDLNVAHREIDLKNPKQNIHSAGFSYEERQKMTDLLMSGFVDTFRALYPDAAGRYLVELFPPRAGDQRGLAHRLFHRQRTFARKKLATRSFTATCTGPTTARWGWSWMCTYAYTGGGRAPPPRTLCARNKGGLILLDYLFAALLGVIEGITEWLPISSTGHLILADEFIHMSTSDAFKKNVRCSHSVRRHPLRW